MRYLFQYRITADQFSCDKPLQFKINGINFYLHLNKVNVFTNSNKLRIITEADNENLAYQNIAPHLPNFIERLIFYTGKEILVNELELILLSQKNLQIRDMFAQGVNRDELEIEENYLDGFESFFNKDLSEKEIIALHHYVLALINDIDADKFRNLYLVIEDLLEKDNNIARCDKCGAELICSVSPDHGSKTYPTILKKDIISFINNKKDKTGLGFPKLDGKLVYKMRQKLFHSQQKKGTFNTLELNEMIHSLSLLILEYFEDKFNINTRGGSVVKYAMGWKVWYKYKARNIEREFDYDSIPSKQELDKNTSTDSYWLNPEK